MRRSKRLATTLLQWALSEVQNEGPSYALQKTTMVVMGSTERDPNLLGNPQMAFATGSSALLMEESCLTLSTPHPQMHGNSGDQDH